MSTKTPQMDLLLPDSTQGQFTLTITAQNTTTRTDVGSGDGLELVEFLDAGDTGDAGVVLEFPKRSCAQGHNLMLRFHLERDNDEDIDISLTAQVKALENLEKNVDKVTLKFVQFVEKDWVRFCQAYSSRQTDIENFLKAAKGL